VLESQCGSKTPNSCNTYMALVAFGSNGKEQQTTRAKSPRQIEAAMHTRLQMVDVKVQPYSWTWTAELEMGGSVSAGEEYHWWAM
jgi:hypothetical protein